ncbi:unnamed protein product [Amoebophrya sp. A25]|nr:unnamed protein product [Amoebophrya sp. A25]|eukprot:GSA25T00000055001.1
MKMNYDKHMTDMLHTYMDELAVRHDQQVVQEEQLQQAEKHDHEECWAEAVAAANAAAAEATAHAYHMQAQYIELLTRRAAVSSQQAGMPTSSNSKLSSIQSSKTSTTSQVISSSHLYDVEDEQGQQKQMLSLHQPALPASKDLTSSNCGNFNLTFHRDVRHDVDPRTEVRSEIRTKAKTEVDSNQTDYQAVNMENCGGRGEELAPQHHEEGLSEFLSYHSSPILHHTGQLALVAHDTLSATHEQHDYHEMNRRRNYMSHDQRHHLFLSMKNENQQKDQLDARMSGAGPVHKGRGATSIVRSRDDPTGGGVQGLTKDGASHTGGKEGAPAKNQLLKKSLSHATKNSKGGSSHKEEKTKGPGGGGQKEEEKEYPRAVAERIFDLLQIMYLYSRHLIWGLTC